VAPVEHRDRDNRNTLPPSTQTSRALPSHTVRAGSNVATGQPSKVASVEGPIKAGTMVTQRFQRNDDGELFERKIEADLILQLDAVVESKGYTAKIRVDVFDAIWALAESAGGYDQLDPQLQELQGMLKDEITEGPAAT